jgi:hypothetical protein
MSLGVLEEWTFSVALKFSKTVDKKQNLQKH